MSDSGITKQKGQFAYQSVTLSDLDRNEGHLIEVRGCTLGDMVNLCYGASPVLEIYDCSEIIDAALVLPWVWV